MENLPFEIFEMVVGGLRLVDLVNFLCVSKGIKVSIAVANQLTFRPILMPRNMPCNSTSSEVMSDKHLMKSVSVTSACPSNIHPGRWKTSSMHSLMTAAQRLF